MLENTIRLVNEARKKGALIVHAPIVFTDDYQEISGQFGILAK